MGMNAIIINVLLHTDMLALQISFTKLC